METYSIYFGKDCAKSAAIDSRSSFDTRECSSAKNNCTRAEVGNAALPPLLTIFSQIKSCESLLFIMLGLLLS